MQCDCRHFCFKLEELSGRILIEGDEETQWSTFEQFLKQWTENIPKNLPCSVAVCSTITYKLTEFRRSDMTLSTLLIDLITTLYFEDCGRRCLDSVWDFNRKSSNRETLRALFALLIGLEPFLNTLNYLGLPFRLSGDTPYLQTGLELELYIFIRSSDYANRDGNDAHDDNFDEDTYHKAIISIAEEAVRLVKSNFFRHDNYINRMYLAVNALNAVQLNVTKKYSHAERFISCLRLYLTATSDVYLTTFEVRSTLYVCFRLINKLHLFDTYCREFDKIMAECPAKREPRKLTHLVRCQIREILSMSRLPLPTAVDKLYLPKKLKSFLVGEIPDISIYAGNVSSRKPVTMAELDRLFSGQPIP